MSSNHAHSHLQQALLNSLSPQHDHSTHFTSSQSFHTTYSPSLLHTSDLHQIDDTEHFGDPISHPDDPPGLLRLYFQNVEGLKISDGNANLTAMCRSMHEKDVSIFGFAESNVEWKNYKARSLVYKTIRKQWHSFSWAHSTSSTEFKSFYKPGGTMTVATGPVQSFVRDKTSDPLGRWSSITLAGRNQRRIRITTAYHVCSNSKPGISQPTFNNT